ncbi:MAG: hypothetical protein ACKVS8_13740 [Phycisphaerales bacterium]
MPEPITFRCTGRDVYLGHERIWFVRAPDAAAARAHAASKGLVAPVVEGIDEAQVPADATVLLVREAQAREGVPRVVKRMLLVALGVALALFLIAGFLFVLKAKEHLLRDRGRVPPGVSTPAK